MLMRRRPVALCLLAAVVFAHSGCIVTLGPEWAELERSRRQPVLRLEGVEETITGSWQTDPNLTGFHAEVVRAFEQGPASSLFTAEPSNLGMHVRVSSDHESDWGRLVNLGALSLLTLGLVPVKYYSEWNVDCTATVTMANDVVVAEYPASSTGTFKIWAFPPTMFTLFTASVDGPLYYQKVTERVANNLAAGIMEAVEADYARLAGAQEQNALIVEKRPLHVQMGDSAYWVTYNIRRVTGSDQGTGGARRQYVLEIHQDYPGRGAAPFRELVIGERAGTARTDTAWNWRAARTIAFYADRRLWYPEWRTDGPYDNLASVTFRERPVSASELLKPRALEDLPPEDLNSFLISWKNRKLDELLRTASTGELRDYVDSVEHMVLEANELAESARDAAQQAIIDGAAGADEHTEMARTYQSRIEILKPILAAVKQEITNRQR
jgi:hypothetical protein